jgi:Tol biopolymer transport system component
MALRRLLLFAPLLALAVSSRAHAATVYDPEVTFETLRTPHFLIMFPVGYEHIALRAGRIAEDTLPHLTSRYGWEPAGRIAIVINDENDDANGSATIIPSKVITVYITPPTEISGLEDYDDWLQDVLTHEMTHIVQLDMVYGILWVPRILFGKYVALNQYTPTWVTEGIAVYEETVSSGSGRGRSSYVDMVVRMAALEDKFPSIDRGYRGFPKWPRGNVAYFIGGRFQLWLAERYGEDKLLEYHRTFATNPIPYFLWIPSDIVFGETMEQLWADFEAEMKGDAQLTYDQVKTASPAMTRPVRLTHYGGDLSGPKITPDGKHIVFSADSPVDGIRVRRIAMDGSDDTILADDVISKAIALTPSGDAIYYSQAAINARFYTHRSLFREKITSEALKRSDAELVQVDPLERDGWLAPSGILRARDPDISPDGKRIVFVQTPYAANRLVLAWLESDGTTIHPKEIVKAEPDVELADPRFSPDGGRIAVSRFKGGRRDVVIFDLEGNLVEEVTRDRAQDVDPTWTSDGRWLVFASDRTGIYNLYAYELETKTLRQLTNLVSGAYQPCVSPDLSTIVYRGYSADGFDVYSTPFQPEKGIVVGRELQAPIEIDRTPRRLPPLRANLPKIPPPAPFTGTPLPEELPEGWSIEPYTSLDTVLPFHDNWNLYPGLYYNGREAYASLATFGQDALGTQTYLIEGTYGTLTKFPGGSVLYQNDQLEPTFSFLGSAFATTYSRTLFVPAEASVRNLPIDLRTNAIAPSVRDRALNLGPAPCPFGDPVVRSRSSGRFYCFGTDNGNYNERRFLGLFSITLPFLARHLFTVGYSMERRDSLDALPQGTLLSDLPPPGRYGRVTLSYAYAFVHAFPFSISVERGRVFSIALSALSKGLGSNYEEYILTSEFDYYLSMPSTIPLLQNHVLVTHLVAGVSGGPDLADRFQLGGLASISAISSVASNFYGLRGIDIGALQGAGIATGTIEYRAPIFRVDHGPGTLPLTLSVFHAAVFCDFGRVFERVNADAFKHDFFGPFAIGIGAEARADVTFTYSLPLTLVAGYAYAVHQPDNVVGGVAANGPYVRLGSTF